MIPRGRVSVPVWGIIEGTMMPMSFVAGVRRAVRIRSLVGAVLVAVVATACGSGGPGRLGDGSAASTSPKSTVTLQPAAGATGVAPATTVVVTVKGTTLTGVAVRSAGGDVVAGVLATDGRSWRSEGKLAFGATYTVRATVADTGRARDAGSFSTAPRPSGANSVRVSSFLGDGRTYGVGMPVILKLSRDVTAAEQRAALEKMLTVRSQPPTVGAWGWVNDREIHFRPRAFWTPGTKLQVTVDTAGRRLGAGLWGRSDLSVTTSIGTSRVLRVDSATKRMQVVENGAVVRTFPVSLGRPEFPSSSGTMLIIDKRPEALFDSSTYGLPVDSKDGYRTEVEYPMRLTWNGEFIHSAPWSVADQGRRNVSHGCINMAPAAAIWLYNRAQVGDPVVVRNTEAQVAAGNGWTAWNEDFSQWVTRSATGEHPTT